MLRMPTERARTYAAIDARGVLAGLLAAWAVLSWLIYPPINGWLLAYLAPAPLVLVAARGESTRTVAVLTYLAGVIWWLVAARWLTDVTVGGYIALAFYLGLYPLLFVMITRSVHRRMRLPLFIVTPIVWVAVEWLRGVMLTGFPWFGLGHSQPTVMIQIADLAGAYGVSFVVAMVAGLIVDLLTQPLVRPGPRKKRINPIIQVGLLTTGIAVGGSWAYGLWRMGQDVTGPSLRIAVVQTDVPQSNKLNPTDEQDQANYQAMLDLSERALAEDPDVIVWPETMLPRPINDESYRLFADVGSGGLWQSYREHLVAFAATHHVSMIVGGHAVTGWSVARDVASGRSFYQPGERFNVAYLVDPNTGVADWYAKVHRVPFGEYVLFEEALPFLADWLRVLAPVPGYSLTPGSGFNLLRVSTGGDVWAVGAPICFEDVFGYACRRMVYVGGEKRADLLVNLTNDGWYPGTSQPVQHEQIARFRCVENRVPMARAVNRGVSGFIDSAGRVIETVEVDGERQLVAGVATAALTADERRTLYGRIGDVVAHACGVVTILLWAGALLRGRRA